MKAYISIYLACESNLYISIYISENLCFIKSILKKAEDFLERSLLRNKGRTNMENNKVERMYKDKLFRFVFREKDKLLSLYNAVNKSNYTNPDDLEIVTLENAVYMKMKEQPEQYVQKLSDCYIKAIEPVDLELNVMVYNINYGCNAELLEACQTLKEYALCVDRIRRYIKVHSLEEAVDRAIDECIKEGILREFLVKYRAEARAMCIFEYDEEAEIAKIKKMEREDEREIWQKEIEKIKKMEREITLIEFVHKKMLKNKTVEQIAEELEESQEIVQPIYRVLKECEGDIDYKEIYEQLHF